MEPRRDTIPVATRLVAVDGLELYAEFRGDPGAPVVVLLHSGLGSTADWRLTAPVLADWGYRAVAYDRPGFGASPPRYGPAPPPFDADVSQLVALLDALGLSRCVVVGYSDGGTIALQAASRHPDRVAGVVAVAAHVCVELKTRAGIETFAAQARGDTALMAALDRRHGDKALTVLRGWSETWLSREAMRWDIRHELAAIDCPTLVVQGIDDEYATPDHARDIAAGVPQSELWLEPGAGHLLPRTHADALNDRLYAFLEADRVAPA